MVSKIVVAIAVLIILGFTHSVTFFMGVALNEPSSGDTQQQSINQEFTNDINTMMGKYSALFALCEQKYNAALEQDGLTALRIRGQQDVLMSEVTEIGKKWSSNQNVLTQ